MKITLKNTPEQIELVKAMASRNRDVAYEAQTALAEFIGPVLAEVINQAPVLSNLFTTLQYNADDNPSIPLDLYYDVADEDYVQVFSQSRAGGLPTSEVLPTSSELKIATYSLDSAVSFDRRYAAKSRMDVVAKTMTRVAQEILAKQNSISANVVMSALANASTVQGGANISHLLSSAVKDKFTLADLNAMMTKSKRIITSFSGGTPDAARGKGVTDIMVSPEIVESLRAIAYQPLSAGIQNASVIAEEAYSAAGSPSFYGINVIELNEMGKGHKFNKTFGAAATAAGITPAKSDDATPVAEAFTDGHDELVLGIDRSRESLVRPVAVDAENGGEFNLIADDQYSIRQSKIGYFGSLEEGRIVLDNRALVGVVV